MRSVGGTWKRLFWAAIVTESSLTRHATTAIGGHVEVYFSRIGGTGLVVLVAVLNAEGESVRPREAQQRRFLIACGFGCTT